MNIFRFHRGAIAFAHDSLMAAASFALSLYLRLGSQGMDQAAPYLLMGTLLFTGISMSVFIAMRLYRGLWRYASIEDLATITRAVTLSILLFSFVMFFISRLEGFPRSALTINWLVLLALLGGPRFLYRAVKDRTLRLPEHTYGRRPAIPVLLIGATNRAELFLRELRMEREAAYQAVAILDSRAKRIGHSIHGVPIYDMSAGIEPIVARFERRGRKPQRIILAGEYKAADIRHFLRIADQLGMTLGQLPSMSEFKEGMHEGSHIRPIAIEDLLGRPQLTHDREAMRRFIAGKRVLVTGAGGSIGGELCRQIASYAPSKLIFFEQNEYALYQIDAEVREAAPTCVTRALLGDVRNPAQLERMFQEERPEIVFHAAAVKHVPLAEDNPVEAIATNVLGSRNVAEACQRFSCATMVLISTDKAVRPANVMGATKRLAEMVCQAAGAGAQTHFVTVRFGNVLGSTGSVVPLFQRQLAKGGPLTVTHPDMVRYFMTIREAVELVIQAAAIGSASPDAGERIFVLDMGEPVRIDDLARQMIRLSGLRPDQDIKITYTGLRPGEKLFEELFYDTESEQRTEHTSIFLAKPAPVDVVALKKKLDLLALHCTQRHESLALALLHELVPDYASADIAPINHALATHS